MVNPNDYFWPVDGLASVPNPDPRCELSRRETSTPSSICRTSPRTRRESYGAGAQRAVDCQNSSERRCAVARDEQWTGKQTQLASWIPDADASEPHQVQLARHTIQASRRVVRVEHADVTRPASCPKPDGRTKATYAAHRPSKCDLDCPGGRRNDAVAARRRLPNGDIDCCTWFGLLRVRSRKQGRRGHAQENSEYAWSDGHASLLK